MASGLPAWATKQVGPLPMGAWAILIPGALAAGIWLKNQRDEPLEPIAPDPYPDSGKGPAGWVAPGLNEYIPAEPDPETNEQWARKAVKFLLGQNYDAGLADSTIRRYLAGLALSPQEQTLLNEVLRRIGSPPILLPPTDRPPVQSPTTPPGPPVTPPVAPTPIPAPRNLRITGRTASSISLDWDSVAGAIGYVITERSSLGASLNGSFGSSFTKMRLAPNLPHTFEVSARTWRGSGGKASITASTLPAAHVAPPPIPIPQVRIHTVRSGDNLWDIAARYYGSGTQWRRVYDANVRVINAPITYRGGRPYVIIRPGQQLAIP